MSTTLLVELVRNGAFPQSVQTAVETALLPLPQYRQALAASPDLTEATWFAAYTKKPLPPVDRAVDLVSRELTESQAHHVVTIDTRAKVLDALIRHNELSAAVQVILADSRALNESVAARMFTRKWVTSEARAHLADRVGGQVRLEWLATVPSDELSDSAANALLSDFINWGPTADTGRAGGPRNKALVALFNRRPVLLANPVVSTTSLLATPAAGCRFLPATTARAIARVDAFTPEVLREFEYALLALVANPVVDVDLVNELRKAIKDASSTAPYWLLSKVQDGVSRRLSKRDLTITDPYEVIAGEALAWVISRSAPGWESSKTRPFDLVALASNPNLDNVQAVIVQGALDAYYTLDMLSHQEHAGACNALLANYPQLAKSDPEPQVKTPHHQVCHNQAMTLPDDIAVYGTHSFVNSHDSGYIGDYLAQRLGNDAQAWSTLFSLAVDYEGPLVELVEITSAVTA
jgi:hypothetical protein